MSKFAQESDIRDLFNSIKNYLQNFQKPQNLLRAFCKAPELQTIIRRTLEFQQTQKLVEEYAFERHRVSPSHLIVLHTNGI